MYSVPGQHCPSCPSSQTHQRSDEGSQKQGDNVSPDREGDVLLGHDDDTENEADDQDPGVPVPRNLFVVLCHVIVVLIVDLSLSC